MRTNYLIYCTANDTNFLLDTYNIYKMSRLHPGIDKINLVVVISDLNQINKWESVFLRILNNLINKSPWINLIGVFKKGNQGRDFSSFKIGLEQLNGVASKNDFVLIRNRSSVGPEKENWYSCYCQLISSKIGLVGNTINLIGYPKGSTKDKILPHVQTYMFLSKYEVLHSILDQFPATNETERDLIIENGEITLSKIVMSKGYEITCYHWKNVSIGPNWQDDNTLPKKDVKEHTRNLPFIHRKALTWVHRKGMSWIKQYAIKFISLMIIAVSWSSSNKVRVEMNRINKYYPN